VQLALQGSLRMPLSQLCLWATLWWPQLQAQVAGLQQRSPDNQQQLSLPEERPQVASHLLCSRVRTIQEAYEVRRAEAPAVLVESWQHACSSRMLEI
jgi:hypothetical protein